MKLEDILLTVEDVAKYLKMSKSKIYRLAQGGKIPASKIGNHWRFKKETIDAWIDEQTQKVAAR